MNSKTQQPRLRDRILVIPEFTVVENKREAKSPELLGVRSIGMRESRQTDWKFRLKD